MKLKIEKINVKMKKYHHNAKIWQISKNIENVGRGKGGWENPLATRSPIRLQTPYITYPDPLYTYLSPLYTYPDPLALLLSLYVTYSCCHLTLSVKKYKLPFYFRIELVKGYYYTCDN